MTDFDAIVVGSGISGGYVAKELCERGLKVLVLERGRNLDPAQDYTDQLAPWERPNLDRASEEDKRKQSLQSNIYSYSASTKHFWVEDSKFPYESPDDAPYKWFRGDHLGGRSIMWARRCYRLSDLDFNANKLDGYGVDWPIRYNDIKKWYDKVESFIGVSGTKEHLPQLPDGDFLPPFELNCGEQFIKKRFENDFPEERIIPDRLANLRTSKTIHENLGRSQCQVRNQCHQGCSYGAYFSSISATLPAAKSTENLTLLTDSIVENVIYDKKAKKVHGVRVINSKTKQKTTYSARIIFLNASTLSTAAILLNSRSEEFPQGLANTSNQVGRNIMDHVSGAMLGGILPGLQDSYYVGRKPGGFYIPRSVNLKDQEENYLRGFSIVGNSNRAGWSGGQVGIGEALKAQNRVPGPWKVFMMAFCEMLPYPDNRISLHENRRDEWGVPIPIINVRVGDNEKKILEAAFEKIISISNTVGIQMEWSSNEPLPPGSINHEMGSARMGHDPATSVLNGYCQSHDIDNLFISDGSVMSSSAVQNPSLTYMALSARSANIAVDMMEQGKL